LYVDCLQAFAPFLNGKLDALTLTQSLESRHLDSRVVDKDVVSALTFDKAVAFRLVEPLHGAGFSLTHFFFLSIYFLYLLNKLLRARACTQQLPDSLKRTYWASRYHDLKQEPGLPAKKWGAGLSSSLVPTNTGPHSEPYFILQKSITYGE
jgi:hypothetical protein